MIVLIDNYDSFVHNLARHLRRLGVETRVVRNDATTVSEVRALKPQAIVLSPGPCTPQAAGVSLALVRELHGQLPMLGVCLGHQTIAEALGGRVVRGEPVHGRATPIIHHGRGLFAGIPSPLLVGRYHSLIVEETTLPPRLAATAWTTDGVIMALAHRELPIYGVQFHPESILTSHGYKLISNFLRLAGVEVTTSVAELAASELRPVAAPAALSETLTPHAWGGH